MFGGTHCIALGAAAVATVTVASTSSLLSYSHATASRASSANSPKDEDNDAPALHPQIFRKFKLKKVQQVTHDTKLFRFEFPEEHSLSKCGLNVASSLRARAVIGGETIIRQYTPVSPLYARGFLDLIVKSYPGPPGGMMSRHIHALPIEGELELKGPFQNFKYEPNMKKRLGMVCGGTGVTPMLQILREILGNPADETQITLIFANRAEEDIILRDELDALSYINPNFTVHFVLERAPPGWQGSTGLISDAVIRDNLPSPADDVLILVCGPEGMVEHVAGEKFGDAQGPVEGILGKLGYTSGHVFKF